VEAGQQDNVGILRYKSFCLDAPGYLLYLFHKLVDSKTLSSADGLVEVHRTEISSLHSIKKDYPAAKVIINASGQGADKLVQSDSTCQMIRGQTLLVQLPAGAEPKIFTGVNSFSSTVAKDSGKDLKHELSYIIPRARSGKVILGGSYEPNRMVMEEDTQQTARILCDSARLWPALIPTSPQEEASRTQEDNWKRIKVLRVNIGFRPGRSVGPRVELVTEEQGSPILHAYGLGGAGYQRSVGLALTVDEKLDEALDTPRNKMSND
jgi:D-amino-acid oxidase